MTTLYYHLYTHKNSTLEVFQNLSQDRTLRTFQLKIPNLMAHFQNTSFLFGNRRAKSSQCTEKTTRRCRCRGACLGCLLHWAPYSNWRTQNRFSPRWVRRCVRRFPASLNFLWQTVHSKGFSPVWVRWCDRRCPSWLNFLMQTVHSKGFSPVWILRCWLSKDGLGNVLAHTAHSCNILTCARKNMN